MFCPHCSQQQVSPEVRFCSRCGFPLDGVAALLANGGLLPGQQQPGVKAPPSARLKGVRQGGMMILMGMFLVPFLLFMAEGLNLLPEEVAIGAALICFLGGFLRVVYALLFEDGPLRRPTFPASAFYANPQAGAPRHFGGAPHEAALPPAQGAPANSYVPPRANTSEIVPRPPSVTEHTTRFLDKQER